MRLVLLLFIAMPVIELWVLIAVGRKIGALATIGLVFLMAGLGLALLRLQGINTLFRGCARLNRGELPAQEVVEGMMLAFCGVLLLIPGFVSDAIALVVLLPVIRRYLAKGMLRRGMVQGGSAFSFHTRGSGGFRTKQPDDSIDAEYWREERDRKSLDDDREP